MTILLKTLREKKWVLLLWALGLFGVSVSTPYWPSEIVNLALIPLLVFAVFFPLSLLAKEERSGLLLTQLAAGVSRGAYLINKYLAILFSLALLTAAFFAGGIFENALADLWHPALVVFLFVFAISSVAFAFSAAIPSRVLSASVAILLGGGAYAFALLHGPFDFVHNLAENWVYVVIFTTPLLIVLLGGIAFSRRRVA